MFPSMQKFVTLAFCIRVIFADGTIHYEAGQYFTLI